MLEGGNFYWLKKRSRIMVTGSGELEYKMQIAVLNGMFRKWLTE